MGKPHAPSWAAATSFQQDTALRVMTYNVWGIPTSTDRQARMVAIGRQLAAMNLDIVGLQECWLEADRDRILAGLAASDLSYSHFYPSALMGSGLMLLSRFPIVDVGFHRYSLNGLPLRFTEADYYGGKGVGYARLDTPNGEIAVFNTHIIACYADDDLFRAHRAAQGYEFARYVESQADGRPVIALGDFNVSPGAIGYQLVNVLGELSNCYEAVHGSASEVRGFIDHIFVRSSEGGSLTPIKAEVTMDQPSEETGLERLSDHDALLVELAPSTTMADAIQFQEQRADVLQQMLDVLEQGVADATARARRNDVQAGLSLGAFIGAEVAGEALHGHCQFGRWIFRYVGMLVALPFTMMQGWQGVIVTQEEINALSGLIEEVCALLDQGQK